ncbi:MAG: redoxin domain-containing protein [Flavobacteriaceae bacterium]
MKKLLVLFVISCSFVACKQQITEVPSFSYEELKPLLHLKTDKTYVVNFWATWCAPCVKELPYFEKINKEYQDKNIEVILVSLDFPEKVSTKLIPFINDKELKSRVVLLNDENEQFWINDISKKWTGALPATLIYNKDKREFYETSFTYETLENKIQSFLK